MNKLAELSIDRPVSTVVGVILVTLFGLIAALQLPIQMKPTIDKPVIQITTQYEGAAPPEVEEQITDRFEEKLNSIEGLRKLSSTSGEGTSNISLEFEWGVNRDARFVDVLEKVNQVEGLPEEADKPRIAAVSSVNEEKIMWLIVGSDSLTVDEMTYLVKNEIKDALERVNGVGEAVSFGGRDRQISVILDPESMSGSAITIPMVREAILRENQNVRGGYIDEGKVRFNVRTVGQFRKIDDLKNLVIRSDNSSVVYLRDIARIEDEYEKISSLVRANLEKVIVIGINRKIGANVVEVTDELEKKVDELNRRFKKFNYQGKPANIKIVKAYNESIYIKQSMEYVRQNLLLGGLLTAAVLFLFLKSVSSTLVVSVVIPICFVSIFLFLQLLDRTINIISLAGIAFAIGMTVDNAIVVIENIYRHNEMGKPRRKAILDGVNEVWGAVLASTLTTMAVFLPILYVKEESGELFRDIGITISSSVAVSLIVSFTVVPMLCSFLLKNEQKEKKKSLLTSFMAGPDFLAQKINFSFCKATELVTGDGSTPKRTWFIRLSVILSITGLAASIFVMYLPPMEYLPTGNRNLILVAYKAPTGTNIHKMSEISKGMEEKIYSLPFGPDEVLTKENRIVDRMFALVSSGFRIIGVIAKEDFARYPVEQLPIKMNPYTNKKFSSAMDYLTYRIGNAVGGSPGTIYAFPFKVGLFNFSGKSFQIEVRGPQIGKLDELAQEIERKIADLGPKSGFGHVTKEFELGLPEIRVEIDRERAAALNLKTSEVAEVVETMIVGRTTGKFRDETQEVDIIVRGEEHFLESMEDLSYTTILVTNGAGVITQGTTLEGVARVYKDRGPTNIFHREKTRSITLSINLDEDKPLEEALQTIQEEIVDPLAQTLPGEYYIELAGSASDLNKARDAFSWAFVLAIIVTYLLMTSLFESFLYPLIILPTVPLAMSGSVLGIHFNEVPFDILTFLGFIILCGIVVNNAILVVHQALNFQAEGMDKQKAIRESVESRLRPVFMSTISTIFGLLPMCVKGAPGSELYSGLGTAIAGGLIFSTLLTLVLIPTLLSAVFDWQDTWAIWKKKTFNYDIENLEKEE